MHLVGYKRQHGSIWARREREKERGERGDVWGRGNGGRRGEVGDTGLLEHRAYNVCAILAFNANISL